MLLVSNDHQGLSLGLPLALSQQHTQAGMDCCAIAVTWQLCAPTPEVQSSDGKMSTTDVRAAMCYTPRLGHNLQRPGMQAAMQLPPHGSSSATVAWCLRACVCGIHSRVLRSQFFLNGKTLPIERGHGLRQPAMQTAAQLLAQGDWVHFFPEGRVSFSGRLQACRWGMGKLICDAVTQSGRSAGSPLSHDAEACLPSRDAGAVHSACNLAQACLMAAPCCRAQAAPMMTLQCRACFNS